MNPRVGLALGLLTLLGACASPWTVDKFEAPEFNVASRQFFFWKGGEFGTPSGMDPSMVATATSQVRDTVVAELVRKGYQETSDARTADLLISFQVAGTRKYVVSKDKRVGAPSPNEVLAPSAVQPPPLSEAPREHTVREGSVIIFAEDPKSGRLVWRGLISAETRGSSKESGLRLVTDMAGHIAQEFPARSVK